MKILHKRILSVIAVAFMAVLTVFTSAMRSQVAVFAAGTNETQYEKTGVLDDLQGSEEFNILNYPFQETSKLQMHVINVVEYCYSFRANQRGNYGLYLYVYNPNGQDILTDSLANKVQIAVKYDSSPVTDKSKPTDYEKFRLQFCSKSAGEYKNLFYKFKVMDHKSADGKTIAERVNSMARRYDISGIELHTRGMDNAIEYPLTGAYAFSDTHKGYGSFTFTGFAKGYGADEEAESTLDMSVSKLETVELEVKHTFYRTKTGTEINHQNQIDTVYFSVPKRLFDDYGKLQRIKAEWYEYVTKEILVTSNQDFYNAAKPYEGKPVGTKNDSAIGVDGAAYNYNESVGYSLGANAGDWGGGLQGAVWGWNLGTGYLHPACNILYYMFPTANWCDIKEYDPYADNVESTGGVSSNRLYEHIKSYNKSFEKGTLPIKAGTISADLFEDDIDESRKTDNERGKVQKGYSYYDFDAELDLQSWQGWGDKDKNFWDNWAAWWYKVPEENGKTVAPIQVIEKDSQIMKLSDTELTDELFINYADVSELRKTYNDAITVSGKDDEEKVLVLFRFAVTDYMSMPVDIMQLGKGFLGSDKHTSGQAYVAKETVFFDFDIIQLSFLKGEDWTVIPCVSSPIDIVNAITTPTHVPNDTPWWQIVLAVVFFVVVVIIVYKLIKGVLSLIFKR